MSSAEFVQFSFKLLDVCFERLNFLDEFWLKVQGSGSLPAKSVLALPTREHFLPVSPCARGARVYGIPFSDQ